MLVSNLVLFQGRRRRLADIQ